MTMVEKIAKDIEAACRLAAQSEEEYCSPAMASAAARAALSALCKPTDAMLFIGADEFNDYSSAYETARVSAHRIFKAMVGAAYD